MDETTRSALAELNRTFYAGYAGDFARTRRGWPLGFERILPHLRSAANVLDVGCGNGRLLGFLTERGWHGRYLGIDGSEGLLTAAEQNLELSRTEASFRQADLLTPHWAAPLAGFAPDAIACLAVLHHVPGAAHRARSRRWRISTGVTQSGRVSITRPTLRCGPVSLRTWASTKASAEDGRTAADSADGTKGKIPSRGHAGCALPPGPDSVRNRPGSGFASFMASRHRLTNHSRYVRG